mgnify:CR=1 FL=1
MIEPWLIGAKHAPKGHSIQSKKVSRISVKLDGQGEKASENRPRLPSILVILHVEYLLCYLRVVFWGDTSYVSRRYFLFQIPFLFITGMLLYS